MKKTLFVILICVFTAPAFAQKQGYCKSFCVRSISDEPNEIEIFTVPSGERFVVLTIYIGGSGKWYLTANDDFAISGWITLNYPFETYLFPDMVAVVNETESLLLGYDTYGNYLTATIVGYFEDLENRNHDLNGDGKINWEDFSIFAEHWLE